MMTPEEMTGQFPGLASEALSRYIEELSPQLSRERMERLEDELKILRAVVKESSVLREVVLQLRDANRKQVIATNRAQKVRDEATEFNRRQNEFLVILVHELRNPLAPIGMAASLLETTPNSTPQLIKIQEIISRQVKHMARLLDDLMDVAHITSGELAMLPEPFLLTEMLQEAVDIVQWRFDSRRQALHVDLPDAPVVIDGDQTRLIQVFSNLLINASKFTPDGGNITITATRAQKNILIAIKDDGMGIRASLLPHLFELFTQGPRSEACSEGGLGVGLSVVRNLVRMHHGEVEVFSGGEGQGSTFTVTLPMSADPNAARFLLRQAKLAYTTPAHE